MMRNLQHAQDIGNDAREVKGNRSID
jgi:hypothetical protein